MAAAAPVASPMLTLGRGTRILCQSARKATELVVALTGIGVPARVAARAHHELPAVVLEAGCEVHFEQTPGGPPARSKK